MRAFIFDLDGRLVDTVYPQGAPRVYRDPRELLNSLDELGVSGHPPG